MDAAAGWIHVEFQSHLNSHETISAVNSFEALAQDNGIIVKGCQSDNGSAFTSKDFKTRLAENHQFSQLAPPGSHHINGKAERSIRTMMVMARTMLLHAAVHWPDQSDPSLWSLAVKHAVWIINHIPHPSTGLRPVPNERVLARIRASVDHFGPFLSSNLVRTAPHPRCKADPHADRC